MPKTPKPKIMAQGHYLRLLKKGRWEFVERNHVTGIVILVALTPGNKLLFVEQFRQPVGKRVVEFPAGLVGDEKKFRGEGMTRAARRELLEETGYVAGKVVQLAEGPVSAGLSNEIITFYLATGLRKKGPGGGVDGENIKVHEVPLKNIPAWLKRQARHGLLVDPKTYVGLYFLNLKANKPGV